VVKLIIYEFDPRELPSDLRIAIGTAVAAWAQTEAVMDMAIAGLLRVSTPDGGAVTTHMPQAVRASALTSLAARNIPDRATRDRLNAIIAHIQTAYEKRNAIAHRSWATDPRNGNVYSVRASAKKVYKLEIIPILVETIEADALFIYNVGIELMAFCMDLGIHPAD